MCSSLLLGLSVETNRFDQHLRSSPCRRANVVIPGLLVSYTTLGLHILTFLTLFLHLMVIVTNGKQPGM